MAFNGNEGSVVTLAEASGWTANYRKTIPAGEIIAHFIGMFCAYFLFKSLKTKRSKAIFKSRN